MKDKFIMIDFTNNKTKVSYNVDNVAQLMSSLLIIEGLVGRLTGLGSDEIREIIDEERKYMVVKPYDDDEIIDVVDIKTQTHS